MSIPVAVLVFLCVILLGRKLPPVVQDILMMVTSFAAGCLLLWWYHLPVGADWCLPDSWPIQHCVPHVGHRQKDLTVGGVCIALALAKKTMIGIGRSNGFYGRLG